LALSVPAAATCAPKSEFERPPTDVSTQKVGWIHLVFRCPNLGLPLLHRLLRLFDLINDLLSRIELMLHFGLDSSRFPFVRVINQ